MKEIDLTNKKILYIGIPSFNYDKDFIKKLIELGATVYPYDLVNLHPDTLIFKALKKLKLKNAEAHKNQFYEHTLSNKNNDYVLVRHGYQLDIYFLEKLRENNPNAKFINFHWDSIRPQYNYLSIVKHFDKVFSFDIKDCNNHTEINYLPLFYLDIYEDFKKNNLKNSKSKKSDLMFIGSWRNMERYNLIKRTEELCKQSGLRFYHYLYFSLKNQIYSVKNGIVPKQAKSKKLSHTQILDLFSTTNTIIDFPSSFQTGLTIRTFETLGAGKKLITTNKNIINEPFYNPEYINVIDIDNFALDIDFIKNKPATSIDDKIKNYSIGNYIKKLLQ
jgi:hypothetical protein